MSLFSPKEHVLSLCSVHLPTHYIILMGELSLIFSLFLLPYCDSSPSNYYQLINPPFFSSISILLQLLLLDFTSRPTTQFLLSLPSLFLHCCIHFHLCHSSPCHNPLTAFCFNFATLPSLIHWSSFFALHSFPFSSLMYSSIYCLWFMVPFPKIRILLVDTVYIWLFY